MGFSGEFNNLGNPSGTNWLGNNLSKLEFEGVQKTFEISFPDHSFWELHLDAVMNRYGIQLAEILFWELHLRRLGEVSGAAFSRQQRLRRGRT